RDLAEQTRGVECRKDSGVGEKIPGAYKPIEQGIDQQRDLVEVGSRRRAARPARARPAPEASQ
ncbi:hypothetical protein CLM82_07630, partial [Streptomyces albidoflavus]|uniref:RtcB family protein n=1 Tax=Streptomyces albidoflavus TaxID=1886 RepID=UPI000BC7BE54